MKVDYPELSGGKGGKAGSIALAISDEQHRRLEILLEEDKYSDDDTEDLFPSPKKKRVNPKPATVLEHKSQAVTPEKN
jgi:hypothetical protein